MRKNVIEFLLLSEWLLLLKELYPLDKTASNSKPLEEVLFSKWFRAKFRKTDRRGVGEDVFFNIFCSIPILRMWETTLVGHSIVPGQIKLQVIQGGSDKGASIQKISPHHGH